MRIHPNKSIGGPMYHKIIKHKERFCSNDHYYINTIEEFWSIVIKRDLWYLSAYKY